MGTPKEMVIPQYSPRYSPPPKRTTGDKWSKLGERRRAYTGTSDSEKSPELRKARRNVGLGFSGFGAGVGVWDKLNTTVKDTGARDKGRVAHGRRRRAVIMATNVMAMTRNGPGGSRTSIYELGWRYTFTFTCSS